MFLRRFLLLSALCAAASTHAESNPAGRPQIFATLPNWTGIWEARLWVERGDDVSGRFAGGVDAIRKLTQLAAHPPLNPAWEAKYQAAVKDRAGTDAARARLKTCQFSFPRVMESPAMFQVLITPEETVILFDTGDVRHIYTDGREHPGQDDLWPTALGDSIGRWDAGTLVVDTVARKPGKVSPHSPVELSDRAHFTERLRRVDASTLRNEMTIEDPERLSAPWKVIVEYKRLELSRMIAYDCFENDRNPVIDGKLTITPAR